MDEITKGIVEEGRKLLEEHKQNLAKDFFERQMASYKEEDKIASILFLAFEDRWEDFTADHYDNSIEVYGNELKATHASLDILFEAGFSIVWVHSHRRGVEGVCDRSGAHSGPCPGFSHTR